VTPSLVAPGDTNFSDANVSFQQ